MPWDQFSQDNEVELRPLEQRDQHAAYQPKDQHLFAHPALALPNQS